MLKPNPKKSDANWYMRLRKDEAHEIRHLEALMDALSAAYKMASKRRETIQRRANGRVKIDPQAWRTVADPGRPAKGD